MTWKKLGPVFCPEHVNDWMVSHAANPFAVKMKEAIHRVYFTCRDKDSRSHIGYVDIDFSGAFKVLNISHEPVVAPGEAGMFDDSGTAMGYYIEINALPHIYYLGWNLKVTVPWLNSIGLARYNEGKKAFEKVSRAPVLDRSNEDPFTISYPSILFRDGKYRMWYGSNLKWGKQQHEMQHVIKYAESDDGINWLRNDRICINLEHPGEYALSKPYVIEEKGKYKMWYSYRANGTITTYRIGYAESDNGLDWNRMDDMAGIDVSSEGWDSEMICYPCVFDHEGKRYMLYNGNGYGRTGFGLAVLEE